MISDRTGLGALERAVLETLHDLGARPDRPHRKSANVVEQVYATHGIGPRYGYETICALSAPWLVHLRLVDFHGNLGGPGDNDRAANPRYTEVRLSQAGALAVAAEHGDGPRLPIGLINGDLAAGGSAPPFDPASVVRATEGAAGAAGVSDAELAELVGPPSFPTGCSVDADLGLVWAAQRTSARLSAHVDIETHGPATELVISRLPFGIGVDAIGSAIASRVDRGSDRLHQSHPALHARLGIPITDIRDESTSDTVRLTCVVAPDADPDLCRERILETWPVTTEVPIRLAQPIPTLVRAYLDNPATQLAALRALIADA